ncbi:hypothetical protein TthTF25_15020 [Thermus thermophilus]
MAEPLQDQGHPFRPHLPPHPFPGKAHPEPGKPLQSQDRLPVAVRPGKPGPGVDALRVKLAKAQRKRPGVPVGEAEGMEVKPPHQGQALPLQVQAQPPPRKPHLPVGGGKPPLPRDLPQVPLGRGIPVASREGQPPVGEPSRGLQGEAGTGPQGGGEAEPPRPRPFPGPLPLEEEAPLPQVHLAPKPPPGKGVAEGKPPRKPVPVPGLPEEVGAGEAEGKPLRPKRLQPLPVGLPLKLGPEGPKPSLPRKPPLPPLQGEGDGGLQRPLPPGLQAQGKPEGGEIPVHLQGEPSPLQGKPHPLRLRPEDEASEVRGPAPVAVGEAEGDPRPLAPKDPAPHEVQPGQVPLEAGRGREAGLPQGPGEGGLPLQGEARKPGLGLKPLPYKPQAQRPVPLPLQAKARANGGKPSPVPLGAVGQVRPHL